MEVRRRAAEGLGFLGLGIDEERNAFPGGDRAIGDAAASVPAFVIKAREDLQIAHEVRSLLG